MSTVAGIDCGTNSIRLLIADIDNGRCVDKCREMRIVRLGEGVDRTGRLSEAAIERTLAAVAEYKAKCDEHGVDVGRIRMVATSASRDAENADTFVTGVREILGVAPEVISGEEEAQLSFTGALSGLPGSSGGGSGRSLVVDLGGGSTEFVVGADSVEAALSVDMGCVRLTERHFADGRDLESQRDAAIVDINKLLDQAAETVSFSDVTRLVGLAGTVTTVTAHALGLTSYVSAKIHGAQLTVDDTVKACRDLLEMSRDERAALGFMHPGRVDVIGAGALVWAQIVQRVGIDAGLDSVMTCEHDILDGIALSVSDRS